MVNIWDKIEVIVILRYVTKRRLHRCDDIRILYAINSKVKPFLFGNLGKLFPIFWLGLGILLLRPLYWLLKIRSYKVFFGGLITAKVSNGEFLPCVHVGQFKIGLIPLFPHKAP